MPEYIEEFPATYATLIYIKLKYGQEVSYLEEIMNPSHSILFIKRELYNIIGLKTTKAILYRTEFNDFNIFRTDYLSLRHTSDGFICNTAYIDEYL